MTAEGSVSCLVIVPSWGLQLDRGRLERASKESMPNLDMDEKLAAHSIHLSKKVVYYFSQPVGYEL